MPPWDGLMRAGKAVMRLEKPVMRPEPALMRFGTPLMRSGEALMWPGEALMCAPSAFPDGFYAVSAELGQNSGRPWSKRDSLSGSRRNGYGGRQSKSVEFYDFLRGFLPLAFFKARLSSGDTHLVVFILPLGIIVTLVRERVTNLIATTFPSGRLSQAPCLGILTSNPHLVSQRPSGILTRGSRSEETLLSASSWHRR